MVVWLPNDYVSIGGGGVIGLYCVSSGMICGPLVVIISGAQPWVSFTLVSVSIYFGGRPSSEYGSMMVTLRVGTGVSE